MEYISINELSHFEFHDAVIATIGFDDKHMTWEVSDVNATTKNTQNKFDEDMCIENASIVFEEVSIESIIFGAYTVHSADGILLESKEATTADPSEYATILENTCGSYCYIYSMEELPANDKNQYRVCFNIDGGADDYDLTMGFAKSIVTWNKFSGIAWYESEEWKKRRMEKA